MYHASKFTPLRMVVLRDALSSSISLAEYVKQTKTFAPAESKKNCVAFIKTMDKYFSISQRGVIIGTKESGLPKVRFFPVSEELLIGKEGSQEALLVSRI